MSKLINTVITLALVCVCIPAMAQIKGSNGIVNVETGLSIRPYEAGNATGNKMVMYSTIAWKCMTWDFDQISGDTYALRNLFTDKTFQPVGAQVKEGASLEQVPCSKTDDKQQWEFIPVPEGKYKIKLSGTELYLTPANTKSSNSGLTLEKDQNNTLQQWRLVAQSPTM